MNKFNRKLVDSMIGIQDERERLETYERLAVCFAYLYWGAMLVWLVSWMIGWETGQNALWLFLLLSIPLHGWAKLNDISDEAVPNPQKITPETARSILKQARWRSMVWAMATSVPIALFLKNKALEAPNGAIVFFGALVFLAVGFAMYGSAVKKVKETLRELREDEGED